MISEYLITLPVVGGNIHSYLITNDYPSNRDKVVEAMLDHTEKEQLSVPVPVVLSTKLDSSGSRLVREYLAKNNPESARLLKEVKDFHLSMWQMPQEDPSSAMLMDLH